MRNPANDVGLRYHPDGFAIRFANDDELDVRVRERLCRIDQEERRRRLLRAVFAPRTVRR